MTNVAPPSVSGAGSAGTGSGVRAASRLSRYSRSLSIPHCLPDDRRASTLVKMWEVEPSGPLRGDIYVRGSKNAVTKHMVAAMLGDGPSTIRNAPEVGDVDITADMLAAVGFEVSRADGSITVGRSGAV